MANGMIGILTKEEMEKLYQWLGNTLRPAMVKALKEAVAKDLGVVPVLDKLTDPDASDEIEESIDFIRSGFYETEWDFAAEFYEKEA